MGVRASAFIVSMLYKFCYHSVVCVYFRYGITFISSFGEGENEKHFVSTYNFQSIMEQNCMLRQQMSTSNLVRLDINIIRIPSIYKSVLES